MPVQRDTIWAIFSAVTASLTRAALFFVVDRLELAFQVGDHAIGEFAGAGEIAAALRDLDFLAGGVQLFLQALDVGDGFLFFLPFGGQRGGFVLQLGQFMFQRRQAVLGGLVGFLLQRLALDLQLHDAAVEFVQLFRLGIDLHAQARARLVHQVDGLVGQEAVGDVAVGQASPPPRWRNR